MKKSTESDVQFQSLIKEKIFTKIKNYTKKIDNKKVPTNFKNCEYQQLIDSKKKKKFVHC